MKATDKFYTMDEMTQAVATSVVRENAELAGALSFESEDLQEIRNFDELKGHSIKKMIEYGEKLETMAVENVKDDVFMSLGMNSQLHRECVNAESASEVREIMKRGYDFSDGGQVWIVMDFCDYLEAGNAPTASHCDL